MKISGPLALFSVSIIWISAGAQSNYLDNYIGNPITVTTIGSSADSIDTPRDLDFKPNSNELWVGNRGTANGSDVVIFFDAGTLSQFSQKRKDTHTSHFMRTVSAFEFGDDGKFACVSEIQSTQGGNSTFMGPALWSGDTNIFAKVFQNNWDPGYPLGSHLDMLHQSPFAMGIAHDSAMAYWVLDGHNGNICKYDFVKDHGPGYEDHSAGKIWRYTDVSFTRVPYVPSHAVLDKSTGWLYYIDGGPKQIKRMDTHSGTITGNLTPPSTGSETLADYKQVEFATVETLATLPTQPCGIDFYRDRLIVSDYTTGDIYLYSTAGVFTLLQTIQTGLPGMMGVKVGPDGHIWCVNETQNKVYRIDVLPPALDVAILKITYPIVENHLPNFYSTAFDECYGSIDPSIQIQNTGTNTITSLDIHYAIDGGAPVIYNWTGSLAAGNSTVLILPASPVVNGSHLLDVTVASVNGTADEVDRNNRTTGSFRAFDAPIPLPFSEDFEGSTFPPAGWNYVHYNPNNYMSIATVGGFGTSSGSMMMDEYSGAEDITGQIDYLITPKLNMTSASPNTWVRFSVAHAQYNSTTNDELRILASVDCGNNWSVIYSKAGAALATAPSTTSAFTPTASQWRTDSVSLAAYAGIPELLLSWTSISNFGNDVYVDDIFVNDLSTSLSDFPDHTSSNVFPNPATDKITVHLDRSDAAKISLRDAAGKLIIEQMVQPDAKHNFEMKLKDHGLAPGIYLLTVNQPEVTTTMRIAIQQNQ